METAKPLSKTVRVSNEGIGILQRRVNEIVRRVEEGTIELSWAMQEIQRIIEGIKLPITQFTGYARPLDFERPPEAALKKSKAPLALRMEHSLKRLTFPERNPERIMAEVWEAACIPDASLNYGRTPINAILGEGIKPLERDIQVINSTIQWLGTNVGQSYLVKLIRTSQVRID